jgi:hypothetical protein
LLADLLANGAIDHFAVDAQWIRGRQSKRRQALHAHRIGRTLRRWQS